MTLLHEISQSVSQSVSQPSETCAHVLWLAQAQVSTDTQDVTVPKW